MVLVTEAVHTGSQMQQVNIGMYVELKVNVEMENPLQCAYCT